jgi:hypothetical protein
MTISPVNYLYAGLLTLIHQPLLSFCIINIRIRLFGTPGAPPNRVGRWPNITPPMLDASCDHLLEKPGLYLDETADFL